MPTRDLAKGSGLAAGIVSAQLTSPHEGFRWQCGQAHYEDINRYLFACLSAMNLQRSRGRFSFPYPNPKIYVKRLNISQSRYLTNNMSRFLPHRSFGLQSTKANLEKQRKTNAKSAREQRQALQMTYQVRV